MKTLLFTNNLAPGDVVVASALLRDLHRRYPGEYKTGYKGTCREYFDYAPHMDNIPRADGDTQVIKLSYDFIHKSNQERMHFLYGYYHDFNQKTGLDVKMTEFRPDIHFAPNDMANPPFQGRYWVIASGGKNDFTAKWWDPARWQRVVDMLRGKVQFVQVGGRNDNHPPLKGVIDMMGRTSFYDLCKLILHSSGVCCVVTCLMHIAAACNRPCVVVAGGREPWWWEAYTRKNRDANMKKIHGPDWEPEVDDMVEHTYLHTLGQLDCCRTGGCWKSKVEPDPKAGKKVSVCTRPVQGDSVKQPECLTRIESEHVVKAVEHYIDTGLSDTHTMVEQSIFDMNRNNEVEIVMPKQEDNIEFPITICVLMYGDYHDLHTRILDGITQNTDPDRYKLRIGMNEVCSDTKAYIKTLTEGGKIDPTRLTLFDEPENIRKYPLMRKMFYGPEIDTRWVLWFDDDTNILKNDWLDFLARSVNDEQPRGFGCFGKKYYVHLKGGQVDFIKGAKWYGGKEIQIENKRDSKSGKMLHLPKVDFATGSFWLIEMSTLKKLNWPDPRIGHNGGDVMLGEALRQNDVKIKDWDYGIRVNDAPRRGISERPVGV
jgi:ADP-heptose:LPS heptosyltransferase